MPVDRWNRILVLGGIRSGKSGFAESLVADAPSVRYVATGADGEHDPEWLDRIEAHQRRRPQSWSTEETGADPARLAAVLAEAKPDDTLLVDDLGGWVTTLLDPARQPNDDLATVQALVDAVRACAGRVVLVSPEVGLGPVPATPVGRAFVDALGTANQALAAACDHVALVVAGQVVWLTEMPEPAAGAAPGPATGIAAGGTGPLTPGRASGSTEAAPGREPGPAGVGSGRVPVRAAAPVAEAAVVTPPGRPATGAARPAVDVLDAEAGSTLAIDLESAMDLPLPDSDAGPEARDRLDTIDLAGAGLGPLAGAVEFAAATQGTTVPRPWTAVRLLLISGSHAGGASAGSDPADAERLIARLGTGEDTLGRLAGEAGADVAVFRAPGSGAMEDGPVLDAEAVDAALRQGWHLADRAADDGKDALVLGSCGTGTEAAAAAVLAAATGAEPVVVLPRVLAPGGRYDDAAWMIRCAAVRDALHRIRHEPRGATDILAQLGGADLAVATGALLGAAARRLPVLLDGPLGIAAGIVARDLAPQVRHWCLLPVAGIHALVRQGADVLGLTPVIGLGMDLGEGANALAALPMLRAAIGLAGALPVHPALLAPHGDAGLTEPAEGGPPSETEPTAGLEPAAEAGPPSETEPTAGLEPAAEAGPPSETEPTAGLEPAAEAGPADVRPAGA